MGKATFTKGKTMGKPIFTIGKPTEKNNFYHRKTHGKKYHRKTQRKTHKTSFRAARLCVPTVAVAPLSALTLSRLLAALEATLDSGHFRGSS